MLVLPTPGDELARWDRAEKGPGYRGFLFFPGTVGCNSEAQMWPPEGIPSLPDPLREMRRGEAILLFSGAHIIKLFATTEPICRSDGKRRGNPSNERQVIGAPTEESAVRRVKSWLEQEGSEASATSPCCSWQLPGRLQLLREGGTL